MKKRLIAFLLCFAMVMPILPVSAADGLSVKNDGASVTSVTLPIYEKEEITVDVNDTVSAAGYQWQILVPGVNLWVNITGANGKTLELSYAMVASLLSGNSAQVRCQVTTASGDVYTDVVTVKIDESEPEVVESAEVADPVVLKEAEVVAGPVVTPAEDTVREIEAPAEAPTVAPTETPAQTENTVSVDDAKAACDAAAAEEAAAKAAYDAALAEEAAAKSAADAAQAAYDAAVAAQAVPVETAAPAETAAETSETDTAAEPVETSAPVETAAPAEPVSTVELDAANAAYAAAVARTAEAKAAYDAASAKTSEAKADYDDAAVAAVEEVPAAATFALRSAKANVEPVADEPEPTKFNIIINYQFTNGETAAQSYAAEVASGSDFYAVVQMPTIQGYLPYVGSEQMDSYTLSYSNVAEDKIITVTYQPTNVDYTIVYKLQNVNGEGYTEDSRETKQGLTDSIVPAVTKTYSGFSMLWYDTPAIAADGSTIVEVYYDRNFYLMLFELDGGYGVEPIYARYGSSVSVGNPSKAGYTFNGWSPEVPATMPVDGGSYTAQWIAKDTATVSIVFWGENPNDEEYSYITTGTLELKPGTEYTYQNGNEVFMICGKEAHTHGDNCTLTCGKTEHTTHTDACLGCGHVCDINCYAASNRRELIETLKPDDIETPTKNGVYTYTTHYGYSTHYYLYLNGKWYCAQDWRGNNDDTTRITSACTHEHTTECYTCEVHSHSAACYSCGKEEHTHTSTCNQTGSGLGSNLWTFVRSETATVAADGSTVINVYYDRTTFTMTFKDYYGTTLDSITDKWGADIRTQFETISKVNTFFWSMNRNGGSPWTSFMDVMPQENRTYYADPQSGTTTLTAGYYGETLTEDRYEILYTVSFKGDSTITVTDEEFVEIEGFTFNESKSSDVGDRYNGSQFYYDRNSYAIEFYSPNALLRKVENVFYEAPLTDYDWTPSASQAPAQYEPGSVKFAGWYLNPECTGDEYEFTAHTMPAAPNDGDTSLTLYAKWAPVTHTVKIYLSDIDAKNNTNQIGETLEVPHGSRVAANDIPEQPQNGNMKFVGWFYMDGEVEKAFDFNNMPVNKDLVIYAKWSDTTVVPYFVYYRAKDANGNVIMDENGNPMELADTTTGQALTGISRTYNALPSEKLIEGYKEGWFPETKSHTMVLTAGEDNRFIFYYVPVDAVPYTVKYLEEGTNNVLHEQKYVEDNRKAVVTENFVVIPGYMPDAYQKRLVVSADGVDNEIIFYYHTDDEHAYYMLSHYTQNLDGTTYTLAGTPTQAIGDVGTEYSAQPQNIPGFTYVESKTEIVVGKNTSLGTSHVLTTDGLEIKHYYDRNSYSYVVRYLEAGTDNVLAPEKTTDAEGNLLNGLYGEVVSENKIDITGYTCISPDTQTLTIRIEEDKHPEYNIITFYYQEKEVKINYQVVGPNGCGTVDLNETEDTPAVSVFEEFKAASGNPEGATATASSNIYKFVGWYDNAECTGTPISTNASYVPQKPNTGWPDVSSFYAKFEYNLTNLTITKTLTAASNKAESFIFGVRGTGVDMDVVIKVPANATSASITISGLTVGDVITVTENSSYNRDYSAVSAVASITLEAEVEGKTNSVTISNSPSGNKWLSESGHAANHFKNAVIVK